MSTPQFILCLSIGAAGFICLCLLSVIALVWMARRADEREDERGLRDLEELEALFELPARERVR